MRRPRLTLLIIIIITIIAGVVDLPTIPIKLKIWRFEIDKTIKHPSLNFWFLSRDLEPKLGLDLKGGSHLVISADMNSIDEGDRDLALEAAGNIISERVNRYGVSEPVIQTSKTAGDYRIIVELPGVTDVNQAIALIGQTAKLEFKELKETFESTQSATLSAQTDMYQPTGLGGNDLVRATASFSRETGKPEVQLEFSDEGSKKFEEITKRNIGKPLGIFLDDQLIQAPIVQSVITGGRAVITSDGFTTRDTNLLAIQLNAGALPVPIRIIEQRNVGPSLGAESIKRSLIAGVIGFSVVSLFMIFYYGWFGLLADMALIIYTFLSLAIFKLIPVTLTLAGIAGFILSIGMAVDANILIFERIKEELRWGQSRHKAIEFGFQRAFASIRDSNVSSLITCAILYNFGSGIVRGFALTLAIGILVSMFSAITVTKTFLRYTVR